MPASRSSQVSATQSSSPPTTYLDSTSSPKGPWMRSNASERSRCSTATNTHPPISRQLGTLHAGTQEIHFTLCLLWTSLPLCCQARGQVQLLATRVGAFDEENLGGRGPFSSYYIDSLFTGGTHITALLTVCCSSVDYCSCKCPACMSASPEAGVPAKHVQETAISRRSRTMN